MTPEGQKTTPKIMFQLYEDPGHAWLAAPLKLIVALGIEKQISNYSYVDGPTVYLEEDCDAPRLLDALSSVGLDVGVYSNSENGDSFIRELDHYERA